MGPLIWVGQKCCDVTDVKLGHVAVLSLRLSAFLHAVFLKSLKQTPKIKTVCTSSPQPWGRCRSIRSATETDTKTHTENIRKHFSFIKDSHVGNWNNVNNYTRFIPRETNSSSGRNKQSDHTIRGWAPWKKKSLTHYWRASTSRSIQT